MIALYIDPGTGSMLFSILIGIVATLFFAFRTFILKLKVLVFSKDAENCDHGRLSCVIYNEGRQYVNVFLPILEEAERRGFEYDYYTSYEEDPALKAGYQHIKASFIGNGNKAIARLNLLSADVCLMTTPGLDVYQMKRSKHVGTYIHILHMPSDATTYRLFGLDYFDVLLLTGDYQKKDIRLLEEKRGIKEKQLITVGCTYLDVLDCRMRKIQKEDPHSFTVLVSPSWGPSCILARYGAPLLDALAKTGMHVIVRPHPQSRISEKEMLLALETRYKDDAAIEWDYNADNAQSLSRADIMISDFSGIIFDYAFLCDKPVLYLNDGFDLSPYDAGAIDDELWQFSTLRKIGRRLDEVDIPKIAQIIRETADSPLLHAARLKARDEAWMHRGAAGKNTVDAIESFRTKKEEKK